MAAGGPPGEGRLGEGERFVLFGAGGGPEGPPRLRAGDWLDHDCGGRDSGLGLSVNLTFAGVPRLLDLASLLVVAWLLFLLCLRFLLEVHSAVDEQVVRPCLCLRRSHDLDLVGSQFVGAAGSAICQQRVDSPMEVVAPCGVPLIVQP